MTDASGAIAATVHDLKKLSGGVWLVQLKPLEPYPYEAGQFTELKVPGFTDLYYTLASAPSSPCLELHIQSGSPTADQLIDWLKNNDSLHLTPASGETRLSNLPDESGPVLLIASGTGFSQAKSIAEDLMAAGTERSIYLYWTGYRLSQLYMLQKAEAWADRHTNVHVSALISEHSHWEDKHQMLVHAILGDHSDLDRCQAICCGSPAMVYTVLDTLVEQGFRPKAMLSDVFQFAPRG
ncbi:MAG: ferredoxin reductase domain-containing protein [Saccharospirillum sp.]